MARGWVGDLGDGMFSAHVEYDEPAPFSYVDGPDRVPAAEAIAWARERASRVSVRVGNDFFSAGDEPLPRLPEWPEPVPPRPVPERGEPRTWRVEARIAWERDDAVEVASRLSAAVGAHDLARDEGQAPTEFGFSVTFTIHARSLLEARETASTVLRGAWRDTGIEATPGVDFEGGSIDVRPG